MTMTYSDFAMSMVLLNWHRWQSENGDELRWSKEDDTITMRVGLSEHRGQLVHFDMRYNRMARAGALHEGPRRALTFESLLKLVAQYDV